MAGTTANEICSREE